MNMDALTAIENFASSIFSAGMDFLFTWENSSGDQHDYPVCPRPFSRSGKNVSRKIYCGDVNQLHARITPGND